MKKLLSQVLTLSLVVVLAKMGAPGASAVYYGVGGANTTNLENAMRFDSISEAYKMQLQLGEEWEIVSE